MFLWQLCVVYRTVDVIALTETKCTKMFINTLHFLKSPRSFINVLFPVLCGEQCLKRELLTGITLCQPLRKLSPQRKHSCPSVTISILVPFQQMCGFPSVCAELPQPPSVCWSTLWRRALCTRCGTGMKSPLVGRAPCFTSELWRRSAGAPSLCEVLK